jgi:TonB family protein
MKTFVRAFLVVLFIGGIVLYNFGLIDVRFEEIRYLLGSLAAQEEASNTFGIVAKYELIKRRMTQGEDNISNYELEARIQSLTSGSPTKAQGASWNAKLYRAPIRFIVNATRFLLGKKIISPKEDDQIINVLEIGYFWERNRKYNEALKIYEDVLKTPGVTPAIKSAVFVHKAFCVSMMGNYKEASAIYETVISLYPNTEAGILSWKLLDFIQSMEGNREALEKRELGEMEKARQFYLVMDFRNAIKNYSIFLGHSPAPDLACEARFYKGRAHEELGESEDAIAEYRWVMKNDAKGTSWAKQANRRMLMIGQFYEQQKSITDEAKRQLEKYQDQVFLKNVQRYSSLVSNSSLRSELAGKDAKQGEGGNTVKDSVLSAILNIGNLDLTGEKSAADQQRKLDSMRNAIIDKGTISQAEMKELERWQTVTQNPYRRPGVLKAAIDGYSNELKYLYNKRLRAGDKLAGKMLVEITILASGAVEKADVVQSDMGDQPFEQAVTHSIQNWKFHAVPASVGDLKIKYPFEFAEEQQ